MPTPKQPARKNDGNPISLKLSYFSSGVASDETFMLTMRQYRQLKAIAHRMAEENAKSEKIPTKVIVEPNKTYTFAMANL